MQTATSAAKCANNEPFTIMHRDENYWIGKYQEFGALWIHDGFPGRPHALLSSGKHSNGFFNSELVMERPMMLDEATTDIVELLGKAGLDIKSVDRVVGPAMGAITLAHDVARRIGQARGYECLRAYTQKKEGPMGSKMIFERTGVKSGENILLVEDVLTTGGSVLLAAEAVQNAGGFVLPCIGLLVNRSGLQSVNGSPLVALIDRDMPMYEEKFCILCHPPAGQVPSEAIRPKEALNWKRLTTTY